MNSEDPVSTRRIIELARAFNPRLRLPPRVPKFLLQAIPSAMGLGGKISGKEPMLLRSQVDLFYGKRRRMNINKARSELGYDPRDGETAARQALAYLADR